MIAQSCAPEQQAWHSHKLPFVLLAAAYCRQGSYGGYAQTNLCTPLFSEKEKEGETQVNGARQARLNEHLYPGSLEPMLFSSNHSLPLRKIRAQDVVMKSLT